MTTRTHALLQQLRHTLHSWWRSPFARNVAATASGTALAQAISLASFPLLTRLYGPEPLGVLGIFNALVLATAAVSSMSYPLAIVLPKAVDEARTLARLSLLLGMASALLAALVLLAFGPQLLAGLNAEVLLPWALLIPVGMLAGVCAQVLSQWLSRHQAFGLAARFTVLGSVLSNGLKAMLGFVQPSAAALILAGLAGSVVATLLAWLRWRGTPQAREPATAATSPWVPLAWRYRDFPTLRTPQDTLNALSQTAPLMLLAAAYGSGTAGQYTLAMLAVGAPVALVGQSVGTVFYPRVTALVQERQDPAAAIWRSTRALAIGAAGPFIALAIAGPWLFGILFGAAWEQAGEFARWLSPWLFLQLVNKPAVAAIPALRLQGGLLVYELASTGSKLLALWLGWQLALGEVASVALFSAAGSLAYLWLIAWVLVRARQTADHQPTAPS